MKRRLACLVFVFIFILIFSSCKTGGKEKFTEYVFGYFDTAAVISGYADSKAEFDSVVADVKALLKEYHELYTIYNKYEGVNNLYVINNSDDPVEVDRKIIDLLLYAKEVYSITGGKTNVAMGSVLSIWHRYRQAGIKDPVKAELPPMDDLLIAAQHTDIDNIIIDEKNCTVFLADPEMSLDVGAIAKGYAVEMIARDLESKGISGYVLNVGGNIRSLGGKADGSPWTVGIENPKDAQNGDYIAYLHVDGQVVVTSGSYQRYYLVNGKPYHHIIDPETLMPGINYLSVSVICKDSGLGDALSTALFIMDYEEGLALIETLSDVEAMWVLPNGEQKYSSGFKNYTFDYEE